MKAVRLLLTAALLVIVWFHAHWSVALCLTLMAGTIELLIFSIKKEFVRKSQDRGVPFTPTTKHGRP